MRVLMLSNAYSPLPGGIATHVKCLARELVARGLSVHIIVPTRGIPASLQSNTSDGVIVHRYGYRHSALKVMKAYRITSAALRAYREIKRSGFNFDIIHQQDVRATKVAASVIARQDHIPLIWSFHSSHMWSKFDFKNHLFLKATRFRADGIITLSRNLLRRAQNNWNPQTTDITYISNGVDHNLFSTTTTIPESLAQRVSPNDLVLFCPSRQETVKGTLHLSEALHQLLTKHGALNLKVILFKKSTAKISKDPYFKQVRSPLEPWINDQVIFLDHVPLQKMPGLYALSDLVVIPSLNEAVNLSMLEAMAMKKPVLASDVGGISEVLTHKQTGWLVPPEKPLGLKNAILKLINNQDLRERIALAGYREVKNNFSWDSIAEQTKNFYQTIIERITGKRENKQSNQPYPRIAKLGLEKILRQ